jgi:hypothetical protein
MRRIVAAVEHCDGPSPGIHVANIGEGAAAQPIAQGRHCWFGRVSADAGRGLPRRMDHGVQTSFESLP